jgi:hypothetical protein
MKMTDWQEIGRAFMYNQWIRSPEDDADQICVMVEQKTPSRYKAYAYHPLVEDQEIDHGFIDYFETMDEAKDAANKKFAEYLGEEESMFMIIPDKDKWYKFTISSNFRQTVRDFDFTELEDVATEFNESAYCDHVPNPRCLFVWGDRNNVQLDWRQLEMVVGRWVIEYFDWSPETALKLAQPS